MGPFIWPDPSDYQVVLHEAVGVLHYAEEPLLKVWVDIDRGISNFYRGLVPKYIKTQPQRYHPHISVVRHEVPPEMSFWKAHEGEEVEFHYENIIRSGEVYIWLNVFSTRLEEIRKELGLPVSSPYTLPPEGFTKCFHTTLGNYKE